MGAGNPGLVRYPATVGDQFLHKIYLFSLIVYTWEVGYLTEAGSQVSRVG